MMDADVAEASVEKIVREKIVQAMQKIKSEEATKPSK